MVTTFLKWGVPSIIVALVAVAFLTTKTFHVERVIAVDEAILWEILSDTERYHEWNPVFFGVDGAYEEVLYSPIQFTFRRERWLKCLPKSKP